MGAKDTPDLFKPFVSLWSFIGDVASAITGQKRQTALASLDQREVEWGEHPDMSGHDSPGFEEEEQQMIRGIMDLEKTTAREIMVPRMDIVAVEADASLAKAAELVVQRGYSRLPVYEDTLDNIIGVVYAKDLLGSLINGGVSGSLRELTRPPHFVPETKRVDELLREFRQKRVHIAIVVDEYGGTAGLVTIEDLLEEIVGEIEDEYDTQEVWIEKISDSEAVMDARVSIGDLNETFGLDIEGEDFDTVGGFVYAHLGKIPDPGDEITTGQLTVAVLSTSGRRIKKVRVKVRPSEEEEA